MPKAVGAKGDSRNQHTKEVRVETEPTPTLAEIGIDKHLAKAARVAAEIPKDIFEEIIEGHKEEQKAVNTSTLTKMKTAHVAHNSGENEWHAKSTVVTQNSP